MHLLLERTELKILVKTFIEGHYGNKTFRAGSLLYAQQRHLPLFHPCHQTSSTRTTLLDSNYPSITYKKVTTELQRYKRNFPHKRQRRDLCERMPRGSNSCNPTCWKDTCLPCSQIPSARPTITIVLTSGTSEWIVIHALCYATHS